MEAISSQISEIEEAVRSCKDIALQRKKSLDSGCSFAAHLTTIFSDSLNRWFGYIKRSDDATSTISLDSAKETTQLIKLLESYRRVAENDLTFSEEAGREGAHALLVKLIKWDSSSLESESDQDTFLAVQDLACEIAALSTAFPMRSSPFTLEELRHRLPLFFDILPATVGNLDKDQQQARESGSGLTIVINQVHARQTAQKDVGFVPPMSSLTPVMWPSAVALSRWLLSNPDEVRRKYVLEIGAGCGLVGLVAAGICEHEDELRQDRGTVYLTDFNDVVVKNIERNISLNGLSDIARSAHLDFYEQHVSVDGWKDMSGLIRGQVDLVLGADIICQKDDAYAAAISIFCALRDGGKAIVVCADSKHRFGVEFFHDACTRLGLKVSVTNVSELYDGNLVAMNMEKTTGFVEGMRLTMYTVLKM
eukprot:scaffold2783_cov129-Cylindrotheca_fusiformis.AAC.7